jgi:organic hydroperoxide reductase OsmC/OhrA
MMGTLAAVLAGKKFRTGSELYRAQVRGDIEEIDGVLKITRISVDYHLKAPAEKRQHAEEALANYLHSCPAAQSVIGCIQIDHQLRFEAA